MSDLNECTFTGRLGADPEIRTTQRGDKVINMRLAVSDQWRDKNTGEKRERTTWVSVVIFSEGLARVAEQYLKKGSRILVRGAFSVREWNDKDGNKRQSTEVVLQGFDAKLIMLDGPGGRGSEQSADKRTNRDNVRLSDAAKRARDEAYVSGDADMYDEIPF